MSTPKLYDLLSGKMGKPTAEALLVFIKGGIKDEMEYHSKALATKEDLFKMKGTLKEEISNLDVKLTKEMSELRVDVEKGFKQQFWLLLVLFLPFYFSIILLLFRLL